MHAVLKHANGSGTIISIDSKAISTTWHDVMTNKRGKNLEEFLIGNRLHIANEESCNTTFQSTRGSSNIYLTIFNNTAIKYLQDRAVYDAESCSDNNIIRYAMGDEAFQATESNISGERYTLTQEYMGKFQAKVLQTLEQIAKETRTEEYNEDKLEEIWRQRVIRAPNIETAVDELQDVLEQAC